MKIIKNLILLLFLLTQPLISVPIKTEIIGKDSFNIVPIINSWTIPSQDKNLEVDEEKLSFPLFKAFPNLAQKLSHVKLGEFPTPITKLEKLGKELGLKNLYLKNDGVSSKPFGGNKIRKLEFLLGDALYNGAKAVISIGGAGSNHTLATTTCCKKLGLNSIVMLTPQLPTKYVRRNLLLSRYHGAHINYYEDSDKRDFDIAKTCQTLEEEQGVSPYFIAVGGSTPLGTIGFINAAFELKEQIEKGVIAEPDFIYVTLGSCGTAVGLILGAKLAGLKTKIIPVRQSYTSEEKLKRLTVLFNETAEFLNKLDPIIPVIKLPEYLAINNDFAGPDYAHITQEAHDAIKVLFETEGFKLDGTYSGKGFSALIGDAKEKHEKLKDKTILFWDTFCSGEFDDIVKKVGYKELPENLHFYFEQDVQKLDQGC